MSSESSRYQNPELIKYLRGELRRYEKNDEDTGDMLCCLLGPEAYNITNKSALEMKRIQDRLDDELAKPPAPNASPAAQTVSMPSSSNSTHRYRNTAQVELYKRRIRELEDDSDVDCMCCLFGPESESYRTKKILERQNYERKLEEELEKPLGPSALPVYSEKAAPIASMGSPSVMYRDPKKINDLKKRIAHYEQKIEQNEKEEDCCVCCLGPSAYAYNTNDMLEKQNLERKLERELARPIDPTIPKESKEYAAMQVPKLTGESEYQNEAKIRSLKAQIHEMDDGYSDTCCVLCFGVEGMAYSSHNEVKKNDLQRKLEKELAKPKRGAANY